MEEKFSCYVFLRTTEVIEVTQEITNTGIIPLEALRAHLSKRPHNNLDMGQEADDEGDCKKDPTGDETLPDPSELELLQGIINPAAHNQLPPVPKSGDKRGPSHLDGGPASSDLSVEDLDARVRTPRRRGQCP